MLTEIEFGNLSWAVACLVARGRRRLRLADGYHVRVERLADRAGAWLVEFRHAPTGAAGCFMLGDCLAGRHYREHLDAIKGPLFYHPATRRAVRRDRARTLRLERRRLEAEARAYHERYGDELPF